MSQRECAGFNWPEFSISAEEPVSISPEAVNRNGNAMSLRQNISFADGPGPDRHASDLSFSDASGVAHPAKHATADSGFPLVWPQRFSLNSSVADSLRQSLAAAVGHAASLAV